MKALLLALALTASPMANATTYYFINDKPVDRKEAMVTSLKAPETSIKRVKVDFVAVNPASGRFKRSKEATFQDIPAYK